MSAEQDGSRSDPYETLGLDREASREEVVQAWRRRARAEHPDSRPGDAAAPARFRALVEAYRVLGDPATRAAYDRATGHQARSGTAQHDDRPGRVRVTRPDHGRHDVAGPVPSAPAAPLRAGPVWVEPLPGSPAGDAPTDQDAALAELVLRYLVRRGRRW